MIEKKLKVDMHCASCAVSIEKELRKINVDVKANPALKIIKVAFDENKHSIEEIKKTIKGAGYDSWEA